VLWKNKSALAADGILYPYEYRAEHFGSMLDFRNETWGDRPPETHHGKWPAVATRVREWDGRSAIVSNELFGGSTPEQIERGLEHIGDADIHVVFTARDLARQLVSDWQEHIKHKHTVTLEKFVDDLIELGIDAPAPFGFLFWGMHDPMYALANWSKAVPVDRIHLVTVPPPGAPKEVLWRRFCDVVGLDADRYDTNVDRANAGLGLVETELIRRFNFELEGMRHEDYEALVRLVLAEQVLGMNSAKLQLPAGRLPWVQERSRQLVEELKASGYHVYGDLEELMPRAEDHASYVSPTELTDADLAPAATRAALGMLRHSARVRQRVAGLIARIEGRVAPGEPVSNAPVDRALRLAARMLNKTRLRLGR
jgi:hypothetical protein